MRAAKSMNRPVAAYTKSGQLVSEYESVSAAAKAVGRSRCNVGDCLNGRTKTCAGYI